jgi:excisionase family DNA binding protein
VIRRLPDAHLPGAPDPSSDDRLRSALETIAEVLAERVADIVVERLREDAPRQPATPDDRLLDPAGAAERLAVSKNAIYKLTESGALPAVKVGGRLRFRNSDIDRFIAGATRSDDRVRELAAEVLADSGRPQRPRRAARSTETTTTRRDRGSGIRRAPESSLTIITNPDEPAKPASG